MSWRRFADLCRIGMLRVQNERGSLNKLIDEVGQSVATATASGAARWLSAMTMATSKSWLPMSQTGQRDPRHHPQQGWPRDDQSAGKKTGLQAFRVTDCV